MPWMSPIQETGCNECVRRAGEAGNAGLCVRLSAVARVLARCCIWRPSGSHYRPGVKSADLGPGGQTGFIPKVEPQMSLSRTYRMDTRKSIHINRHLDKRLDIDLDFVISSWFKKATDVI